jgi:hypothetical protein
LTPTVKHWIPTREYRIVAQYLEKYGNVPANLTVRLSAHMVDTAAPSMGLPTSTVHAANVSSSPFKVLNTIPTGSHVCPAPKQGNQCLDCRACWNPKVANVSYHIH